MIYELTIHLFIETSFMETFKSIDFDGVLVLDRNFLALRQFKALFLDLCPMF